MVYEDPLQAMRARDGNALAKRVNRIEHWLLAQGYAVDEDGTWSKAQLPATSPVSFAQSGGPATKPWPWHGASHPSWQTHDLREIIEVYFKSLGYTPPELRATWIDSSTLQLMLVSRTPSGSNAAGNPGHQSAAPEEAKGVSDDQR